MRTFRLAGIDHAPFEPLFRLSDDELSARQAVRVRANAQPGYPCRVSLCDAEVGEELLLLPYEHQPARSPYRAGGPIYVRRDATRRILEPGEMPTYVTRRMISVRAYDSADLMIDAQVCDGRDVADVLHGLLENRAVAYLHLHNAARGCFSCVAYPVARG